VGPLACGSRGSFGGGAALGRSSGGSGGGSRLATRAAASTRLPAPPPAVAAASGAASVRVWQITSRGPEAHARDRSPPERANVAYALDSIHVRIRGADRRAARLRRARRRAQAVGVSAPERRSPRPSRCAAGDGSTSQRFRIAASSRSRSAEHVTPSVSSTITGTSSTHEWTTRLRMAERG